MSKVKVQLPEGLTTIFCLSGQRLMADEHGQVEMERHSADFYGLLNSVPGARELPPDGGVVDLEAEYVPVPPPAPTGEGQEGEGTAGEGQEEPATPDA
jgi:hypothetical protein